MFEIENESIMCFSCFDDDITLLSLIYKHYLLRSISVRRSVVS